MVNHLMQHQVRKTKGWALDCFEPLGVDNADNMLSARIENAKVSLKFFFALCCASCRSPIA
jgi:hypothetical protein